MSLKGRTNFGKKKLSIITGIRALDPGEREKFFDYRIVGPKAPQGCFSPKRVFLCKFSKKQLDLHSKMRQMRNQKVRR